MSTTNQILIDAITRAVAGKTAHTITAEAATFHRTEAEGTALGELTRAIADSVAPYLVVANVEGCKIDLQRMREAALHAQVHGYVFKADGSEVRQVLDCLHGTARELAALRATPPATDARDVALQNFINTMEAANGWPDTAREMEALQKCAKEAIAALAAKGPKEAV